MKCMLSVAINQQYSKSFLLFQHLDSPSPVFFNGIQRVLFLKWWLFLYSDAGALFVLSTNHFSQLSFSLMCVLSYAQVVNRCEILDIPQVRELFIMVFCKQNVIIDNPCNKCDKDRSEIPVINTNQYSLSFLTGFFNFLDLKN